MSAMSHKPWEHAKSGGSEADELAARFVESLSYDTRLYKHDIAGSIAHARMLHHVELITADDLSSIERGLTQIEQEIDEQGEQWGGWKVALEDVHMCIEAALIEKIGDPGRKLHTGRSRNDQVALDLHLWAWDAHIRVMDQLIALTDAFMELGERQGDLVLPSYTHLQRAQPIVLGGEIAAWVTAAKHCSDRLHNTFDFLGLENPLGSGAIAGSSLPIDREHTAQSLHSLGGGGVKWPSPSSIFSTASRDVALDFVYALSMTAMWLSRWAEQWIIYMSAEFGFLSIGDAYTTGSSMMPQKRNPDMLELIRGRCGNVYGHLMALLTMCKGLTIGYNRDLQEDKRHVFAAYDTVTDCLEMATRIVRSAKFNEARIREGLGRGFLDATSLAEYLVTKGVPFRTAHQVVGEAVRHCEASDRYKLEQLSIDEFNEIAAGHEYAGSVTDDVYEWLGPDNVVRRYQTYGNAGVSGFTEQLAEWKQRLRASDEAPESLREDDDSASGLFGVDSGNDEALIDAYRRENRTLDDLPYTEQFEAIAQAVGAADRAALFHRLHNLRKAGRLPKGLKAWEKAPVATAEQAQLLIQLVCDAVGQLSLRDQLPYTTRFDDLVQQFNARAGLNFSPYQVWRVIAKLAK